MALDACGTSFPRPTEGLGSKALHGTHVSVQEFSGEAGLEES